MGTLTNYRTPSTPYWTDPVNTIRTNSRVRMWILTAVFRYEIASVGIAAQRMPMGWTYSTRTWALTKARR